MAGAARGSCTPAGQAHPLAEDAVGSSGDDFADAGGSESKPATLKWSQALEDRLVEYVDVAKVCFMAALLTQDHLGTHSGQWRCKDAPQTRTRGKLYLLLAKRWRGPLTLPSLILGSGQAHY